MSVRTLGKSAGGGGGGGMVTGTYTGDGNASKAIAGVGFQPVCVIIFQSDTADNVPRMLAVKITNDLTFAKCTDPAAAAETMFYLQDQIISLDADGFTVGDGTGSTNALNINTRTYTYIAWG